MVNIKIINKPKIIFIPYPAQGHVTPMLKFASTFLNYGFQPVLVTPDFIHRRIISTNQEISYVSIPSGLDSDAPRDFFAIESAMESVMPVHLEKVLLREGEERVACVVVDLLASWAVPVAESCGVPVAGFWPAMLATYRLVEAIPELVRRTIISHTGIPHETGKQFFLPNQPPLSAEDFPWLIGSRAAREGRFRFWKRNLERSRTLPWLLVNSFPDEYLIKYPDNDNNDENGYSNNTPKIFPVGPLSNHASTISKNPSLWEEDMSCLEWLDMQEPWSVIYISFGSWVAPIGESKIRSLAVALESMHRPFIWVLDPSWCQGLPSGFTERVLSIGRIVAWAPQMEVLRHPAVGCYLTHCGWNSTVEAVQCTKRLLCYPVAGDQHLNCRYIVEVWRIGRKIDRFEERDIEEGVRRVMEDEDMDERLRRLHERVMGEEAGSRVTGHLSAFVDDLKKKREIIWSRTKDV